MSGLSPHQRLLFALAEARREHLFTLLALLQLVEAIEKGSDLSAAAAKARHHYTDVRMDTKGAA